MPRFAYIGDDERDFLYPRAFTVKPGDVVEAEENPYPEFFDEENQPGATAEKTDEKE